MTSELTKTMGKALQLKRSADAALYGGTFAGRDASSPALANRAHVIVTLASLMCSGVIGSSLIDCFRDAKDCGVTAEDAACVIAFSAFCLGIARGRKVRGIVKEIWRGMAYSVWE